MSSANFFQKKHCIPGYYLKFITKATRLIAFDNYRPAIDAARADTNIAASPAMKEAGNYRKGRVVLHGFSIVIENPKGSYRRGTDASGRAWKCKMGADYGYFTRRHGSDKTPMGMDGDPVDVFIADHPESELVFVVNQVDQAGKFDEHKVIFGARNEAEARKAYLSCYSPGWSGLGSIVEMTMPQFRTWLAGIHNRQWLNELVPRGKPVSKAEAGKTYHWCNRCSKAGHWTGEDCPLCGASMEQGDALRDPHRCSKGHIFDAANSDESDPDRCPRCGELGNVAKSVSFVIVDFHKAIDRIGGTKNLALDFSAPSQEASQPKRSARVPAYDDVAEALYNGEDVPKEYVRRFPVLAADFGLHEKWNPDQKVNIISGEHAGKTGTLGNHIEMHSEKPGTLRFRVQLAGGETTHIGEEHFDPSDAHEGYGRRCYECGRPSGNGERCASCVLETVERENNSALTRQQDKLAESSSMTYDTPKPSLKKGDELDSRTPSGASLTGHSRGTYIVNDSATPRADTDLGAVFFETLEKAFTGEEAPAQHPDPMIGLMPESHWRSAKAELHHRKNVVYLNDAAASAFHTAFLGDSARLHREGGKTGFDGAHAPSESLRFAADGYRNLANASHIPFSDHSRHALRAQADVFDAAAHRHPEAGAMILPRSDDAARRPRFGDLRDTVRHERAHGRLDEAGAVPFPLPPSAESQKALESHPAYHPAIAALKNQGYDPHDRPGLHEELAAHIAGGHHRDLGLSNQHAGELIGHLATHLAAVHGVEAVKHIFSGSHGVARRALKTHGLAKAFGFE